MATGKRVRRFIGDVHNLAFSSDGATLSTSGADGIIHLWDLSGRMRQPLRLDDAGLATRWKGLLAGDENALWELACCPGAPAFIAKRLQPQRAMPEARWKRLLADLDGDGFDARRKAEAELVAVGPAAAGAVRQALAAKPSLDVRLRLERVLATWDDLPMRRAVAVLGSSLFPEARTLLEKLAAGAPGAPLTEEAKAVLRRR